VRRERRRSDAPAGDRRRPAIGVPRGRGPVRDVVWRPG